MGLHELLDCSGTTDGERLCPPPILRLPQLGPMHLAHELLEFLRFLALDSIGKLSVRHQPAPAFPGTKLSTQTETKGLEKFTRTIYSCNFSQQ
jgi:hypothetical protein